MGAPRILAGGGEATVCEALFVEGPPTPKSPPLVNKARDAEYAVLRRGGARAGADARPGRPAGRDRGRGRPARPPSCAGGGWRRWRHRLFGARTRGVEGAAVGDRPSLKAPARPIESQCRRGVSGRVWLTRRAPGRPHGQRWMSGASSTARRGQFVAGHDYHTAPRGALDMFQAEFTPRRPCTFEGRLRFGLGRTRLARSVRASRHRTEDPVRAPGNFGVDRPSQDRVRTGGRGTPRAGRPPSKTCTNTSGPPKADRDPGPHARDVQRLGLDECPRSRGGGLPPQCGGRPAPACWGCVAPGRFHVKAAGLDLGVSTSRPRPRNFRQSRPARASRHSGRGRPVRRDDGAGCGMDSSS